MTKLTMQEKADLFDYIVSLDAEPGNMKACPTIKLWNLQGESQYQYFRHSDFQTAIKAAYDAREKPSQQVSQEKMMNDEKAILSSTDESVNKPSPTAGMNIAQRILYVGGRTNAAGYIEFDSIQPIEALIKQVLRDIVH